MQIKPGKIGPCSILKVFPYAFLIVFPMSILVFSGLGEWIAGLPQSISLMIPSGRKLDIYGRSIIFAFLTALFDSVFGFFCATVLWRLQRGIWRYLRWLPVLFSILPSYIHAASWMKLLSGKTIAQWHWLSMGMLPSVLVQGLTWLPAATALILSGLIPIGSGWVSSGQILSDDHQTWKKILLPLLKPQWFAVFGLMFAFALTDYTIPSIFSMNVYAMESFVSYSADYSAFHALLTAIPLMVAVIPVFVLSIRQLSRYFLMKPQKGLAIRIPSIDRGWRLLQAISIGLLFLSIMAPFSMLFYIKDVVKSIPLLISENGREFATTAIISFSAAVIGTMIAAVIASDMKKASVNGIIWFMLPLMIPGPIVGASLAGTYNQELFGNLYYTLLMPILACIMRFVPVGALIIASFLSRLPASLLDSAVIIEANNTRNFRYILLPVMLPAYLLSAGAIMILSAGELGATIMVLPAGWNTLTLKIYNYLHYGSNASVMLLCLIQTTFILLLGMIAVLLLYVDERKKLCK